ncbi:WbqC family protein [Fulvivirga ulvae]|uniref:WbqC family protein n=1 Tax=Fulvivirga ulvae TaxID=2904245 RepID=UPI001F38D76B|nr:WbqC family protein [Fulvivirga ulvae]UII30194.1 WbqC family protein [Fulvivirga ulvae]
MIISVMQPTYLPWMGYFALIDCSDKFVIYDDVQFEKQSWQQRNRIKTNQGVQMLTIPVSKSVSASRLIYDIMINENGKWRKKHLKSIEQSYRSSAYFQEVFPVLESCYLHDTDSLSEFNSHIIMELCGYLGIDKKIVFSSSFRCQGVKVDKLINIVKYLGADEYLSPIGSFEYINENNLFEKEKISLHYQNFRHPRYNQLHGEFISHMSIIDLLFNEGKNSLQILRSGILKHLSHEEVKML